MIIFCDKNIELCHNVLAQELPNVTVAIGDIFRFDGVIVSASNPQFTFGGGLDAHIARKYPQACREKQQRPGYPERCRNAPIIFTITVDDRLQATPELVGKALRYAVHNYNPKRENLLLIGLGTGIGGLPDETFLDLLSEAVTNH